MFEVPTDEVEPGMVVQVVQSGYMLHDRLLRPAMVGVSKAALPSAAEKTDTDS
jgi:molecular chaperone GrpE